MNVYENSISKVSEEWAVTNYESRTSLIRGPLSPGELRHQQHYLGQYGGALRSVDPTLPDEVLGRWP